VTGVPEGAGKTAADLTTDELRFSCPRHLCGHGRRRPGEVLAEIGEVLGDVDPDRYGAGGVVAELEAEVRELLGKPAAVFMPSGTMAQQVALRVHAERTGRRTVLWHPTCHLQLHENEAPARLHDLHGRPVGDPRRLVTLDELTEVAEPVAALLLELPQREIGGLLPSWDDLVAQTSWARASGAAVHLDGARLWESAPHYGRSLAEVAGLFDSVYVSLYKGLGGLAGCLLAGDESLVAQAREWRQRHGGTLFSMWPYAAAGLAGLRRRLPLMTSYAEHARAIATELSGLDGVEVVPEPPATAMMHVYLQAPAGPLTAAIRRLAVEQGTWTWPRSFPSDLPSWQVVELTVGDATMSWSPAEVRDLVTGLLADARGEPA
jgi:threonine aldolase